MADQPSSNACSIPFPTVGRDDRIDLDAYTVRVHGRDIIDYEKLKADNPTLYIEILANEYETDRQDEEEITNLKSRSINNPRY